MTPPGESTFPVAALATRLARAPKVRRVGLDRRSARSGGDGPHFGLRTAVMGITVATLLVTLVVRLWYLQLIQKPSAQELAVTKSTRIVTTPAPRGLILSRNGKVLAGSNTTMVVAVTRQSAQSHPKMMATLEKLIGVSSGQVRAALANVRYSPYAPVPIATNVSQAAVVTLRERQASFPGVSVELLSQRSYPNGPVAAHILGYTGPINATQLSQLASKGYQAGDQIGDAGMEYSFEKWLRGVPSATKVVVDAAGNPIGVAGRKPGQPGDTVVSTIDLGLQKAVDSALATEIKRLHSQGFPATGGASVVLDPNNGQVLAMASYPTYNPNQWVGGISQANYSALTAPSSHYPLINRAIQGLYTPGSTFKLATATAALQDGLITPSSLIVDSNRAFTIPGCNPGAGKCSFFDNAEARPAGPINVVYALSASNDVFFYNLGYQFWMDWLNSHAYGQNAIQNVANSYGLGLPNGTGINLPGELGGAVDSLQVRQFNHSHYPAAFPNKPGWYAGDNIEMAFGQGETEVTPLELATAYSTFANGGTRYVPQVAAGIVSPDGKLVKRFAPKVAGHVAISPANRAAMMAGFKGAVTQPWGTAYYTFQGFPFNQMSVAGKTGTASMGPGKKPNSLFVAMAPASHPRYVIATAISQAGYGATGAAVATRQILQYLIAHPVPQVHLP